MTLIVVPAEQAETLATSGASNLFPSGPWQGRIDLVRTRGIPTDKSGNTFAGYESDDGEVLSLQIGTTSPLDGQNSVGDQKFFVDIAVRDGSIDLTNIDVGMYNSPNWQLQMGARRIVNLAISLGAATLSGTNGDAAWSVEEDFVSELAGGAFDGREIGFTVKHRTTKSEKTPVVAELEGFHQLD